MKNIALIIGSMMAGGIIAVGGYTYFAATHPSANTPPATEKEARKVLFWYDPMYPNTRFDKPGKSPFMDMDLVPKYADEESASAAAPGVRIDPTQTQNLGVKTEAVRRGPLTFTQTFPANVSYNEYQFVIMQARAAGFVEKVWPLTVGDKVKKGAPLLELTIPDWVEAQSEYLLLKETGGTATQVEGILERLRLAGMPEADIRRLTATRKIQTRFTLTAPIDGVITAFDLRAGMNIAKDNVVAKIQGMDPVWVTAAVPESIAWLIKDASPFSLTVPARPDKSFTFRKWMLLPSADATTRTLQLRLEVDNPDEALKPGMNAYLNLKTQSEPMLLIPSKALIDTGNEQRVITVDGEGRFVPKPVSVFQASQGVTAIRSGLAEGEKVVASGLFLIDSEANISGALDRMRAQQPPASPDHAAHAH
ncbi:efflux RND transporter periplasmic adaptor subunit [Citrobacter freundii complex sp. CFNIH2]|jgi:Cu(I)/Ag(I) efflux system membrane fusion protein|uniref:efflux RND transporter periplasmic adaptor subunit n=1 Tax=Citrobacter TaxID=544 RepID=UPI000C86AD61|nr:MULTISPECIES: efflux RND transporter periplasmic adaptor subunit [Citrobacter]AUO65375.1 efflux transporter periplasmic adaptor subunit [Citrobacter freundii complex sp. CFNIH2]MDT7074495.1 efflux RND transporter periplasmic adaptor subunit [Citrobacter amalonaticus]HAU5636251.1 efflux RND transporter periplasmic adaptor subunit [Citrobacter amalonaticus]HDQ2811705.1 efflux RND transporter periplasmic adaptor subunit [Citrobacter amalonaticus]